MATINTHLTLATFKTDSPAVVEALDSPTDTLFATDKILERALDDSQLWINGQGTLDTGSSNFAAAMRLVALLMAEKAWLEMLPESRVLVYLPAVRETIGESTIELSKSRIISAAERRALAIVSAFTDIAAAMNVSGLRVGPEVHVPNPAERLVRKVTSIDPDVLERAHTDGRAISRPLRDDDQGSIEVDP